MTRGVLTLLSGNGDCSLLFHLQTPFVGGAIFQDNYFTGISSDMKSVFFFDIIKKMWKKIVVVCDSIPCSPKPFKHNDESEEKKRTVDVSKEPTTSQTFRCSSIYIEEKKSILIIAGETNRRSNNVVLQFDFSNFIFDPNMKMKED